MFFIVLNFNDKSCPIQNLQRILPFSAIKPSLNCSARLHGVTSAARNVAIVAYHCEVILFEFVVLHVSRGIPFFFTLYLELDSHYRADKLLLIAFSAAVSLT